MRRQIDIDSIKTVALALGELNEVAVFVGGAVVSVYINDPAADESRPTKSVDIALEIVTAGQLEKLQQELVHKGFTQKSEEQVMCRFCYQDILVDVMSTVEVAWAPANKWFMEGFSRKKKVDLGNGIFINVLPMAYFLAAKWDAYHSRGNDPRTSHDFEDIIYLLDNTLDFTSDIISSPQTVKEYLRSELASLLSPEMYEAVLGHMNPFSRKERFPMLLEKLNMIFKSRQ